MVMALLVTGCGCGDEGCSSLLSVRLPSTPTEPFRIEVSGDGGSRVFDCPDPQQCGPGAVFANYLPRTATVRVTVGTRARETVVEPSYRTIKIGGPFCGGPECQQAFVSVPLP